MFFGGRRVAGSTEKPVRLIDPATGEAWASVHSAGTGEVNAAVASARDAFRNSEWSRLGGAKRSALLTRLADRVESEIDELAALEARNVGMPLWLAKAMLPAAVNELRYNAGWCTRLNGETIPMDYPWPIHAYTVKEAMGVVAAIVPWNVPLATAIVKLGPALAAGCCVIVKPAEETPLSVLRLGELAHEVGFPDGVIGIVTGTGDVAGAALAAHNDVDKVTFTGSTATGRAIVEAALGNFKRVTLELGGKSPILIMADADLEKATQAAARSIFINSGQVCSAASRLYADRSIYDEVIRRIIAIAGAHKLRPWNDPEATMGPLASERQLQRVARFVDAAVADGARLLTGGKRIDRPGWFYEPTVIEVSGDDQAISREEIFGPVLVVQPVDGPEEMIAKANDTDYGLAAYIWTSDIAKAQVMARQIDSGGVFINSAIIAGPNMPFGGYKRSGWGRERGREGIDAFLQTKSIGYAL